MPGGKVPELYERHRVHGPTAKGLMIGDEWRHAGRIGIARGMLATLNPGSVLDVGCGYGDASAALHPGCHYVGVDYTGWIVETARERYPSRDFHQAPFERFHEEQISNGGFELVLALGVLATVPPEEAAAFCRKLADFALRHVMLGYLDAAVYRGRLQAYRLAELDALLAPARRVTRPVHGLGDAIDCTALYELAG